MGHGHVSDKGHWHFLNSTCDMGTPHQGPLSSSPPQQSRPSQRMRWMEEQLAILSNAGLAGMQNRVFSRPVAWPVVTMETVGQTNQRTMMAGAQALSAHYVMLIRPLQAFPLV